MIGLSYPALVEIDEYDLIVNAKHHAVRTELVALRPQVVTHYDNYVNSFQTIHALGVNPHNEAASTVLKNCYRQTTAPLEVLKKRLIDAQNDPFSSLCPYCLIMNHSTFDHYIPFEEYPAYSVLAKNLVPCCDRCNKKKLEYWRDSGQRSIFHFYCDAIPQHRFLRCNLSYNVLGLPVLTFSLHLNNIPMRNLIEKHFERLDLIDRYNKEAPGAISDVGIDIESLLDLVPSLDQVRSVLQNKASFFLNRCGNNYWLGLCYETLAGSDRFIIEALE